MSQRYRYIHHSHFDPIWRRGWQRPIEVNGTVYQPYAVVEALVIDRWIELAESDGVTFGEGQAAVWRSYFQRRPERLETVRALYNRGLLDLFCCGEVIADSNMPSGEAYVRNVQYGMMAMEELFGPRGRSNIGWLFDAFGNAAQLPQIFKAFECDYLFRLSYNTPDGEQWRGLDGTTIRCVEPWQEVNAAFANHKYPPCPACAGHGCDRCDGYGLDTSIYVGQADDVINAAQRLEGDLGVIMFLTEECVPQRGHVGGVRALREQGLDAGYGLYRQLLAERPAKDEGSVSTKCDLNPANCGCYVTRIKTKQWVRRLECRLASLEQLAAASGVAYDPAPVRQAWRTLSFMLFHDAITGTHVDGGYEELAAMYEEVDAFTDRWQASLIGAPPVATPQGATFAVVDPLVAVSRGADTIAVPSDLPAGAYQIHFNETVLAPHVVLAPDDLIGLPALPASGPAVVRIAPAHQTPSTAPTALENDTLRVEFDERWLTAIVYKQDGQRLDAPHRRWRPLDITAEPDYGDPWTSFVNTNAGMYQWALSPYVTSHALARAAGGVRLRYSGEYRGDNKYIAFLRFIADFYLWEHAPHLDLVLAVDWDTRSTRLRLALPVEGNLNAGWYEVPFGNIERARYDGNYRICGTNGDWPAQTWVDVPAGPNHRVALLNTGTPSHRVQDGVLSCSFLRSPDAPTMLNETAFYEFHAHDGMRDAGSHRFRFRLLPHAPDLTGEALTAAGVAFNTPLLAAPAAAQRPSAPLGLDIPGVGLTALKRAEDGRGWIVRLVELRGRETSGTLTWHAGPAVFEICNMMEERRQTAAEATKQAVLCFRPFEIKTLRIS